MITAAEIIADYENNRRLYFRLARHYGASPEDAEDIIQAAFVDLLSRPAKLRKPESVSVYFSSVARYQSFMLARVRRSVGLGKVIRFLGNADASPLDRMIHREQLRQIDKVTLTPRCRAALVKVIDGRKGDMTHAEQCAFTRVRRDFRKVLGTKKVVANGGKSQ